MYRPSRVLPKRNDHATTTANTNGTTHGTPRNGTRAPRLTSQINTSTTPATAMTAIVAMVILTGGALKPCARRRAARGTVTAANNPISTASTIQLNVGLMLVDTRFPIGVD